MRRPRLFRAIVLLHRTRARVLCVCVYLCYVHVVTRCMRAYCYYYYYYCYTIIIIIIIVIVTVMERVRDAARKRRCAVSTRRTGSAATAEWVINSRHRFSGTNNAAWCGASTLPRPGRTGWPRPPFRVESRERGPLGGSAADRCGRRAPYSRPVPTIRRTMASVGFYILPRPRITPFVLYRSILRASDALCARTSHRVIVHYYLHPVSSAT